jgi:hypothetical protein
VTSRRAREAGDLVAEIEAAVENPPSSLWDVDVEDAIAGLGELQVVSAIPLIVRACEVADDIVDLHDVAGQALAAMGAAGIEALLEAHAHTKNAATRRTLEYALVELGARDERILTLLRRVLGEHPDHGATLLSVYGDPAALPALEDALGRFEIGSNGDGPFANHAVIELVGAIEGLGGVVSDDGYVKLGKAQRAGRAAMDKMSNAFAERSKPIVRRAPAVPAEVTRLVEHRSDPPRLKVGRNEHCWCGSGKKYKRCHLQEDAGR